MLTLGGSLARKGQFFFNQTFRMSYWYIVEQFRALRSGLGGILKNHIFSCGPPTNSSNSMPTNSQPVSLFWDFLFYVTFKIYLGKFYTVRKLSSSSFCRYSSMRLDVFEGVIMLFMIGWFQPILYCKRTDNNFMVPRAPKILIQVRITKTSISLENSHFPKISVSACRAQRDGSNGIWVV